MIFKINNHRKLMYITYVQLKKSYFILVIHNRRTKSSARENNEDMRTQRPL
jgi:hypothetical protein